MRRKDKELKDTSRIENLLTSSPFCHVAMNDGDYPYCIPMCYGYHEGKIYLHSASEGKKIDILRKNSRVCILVEQGCSLIRAESPCGYGMAYESVMIKGNALFLSGKEKERGLEIIATRYSGAPGGPYHSYQIAGIEVLEVIIESCSGRVSGKIQN